MGLNVASGSYSGNGSDNRNITGVGFRPKLLFIKGNNSTSSASGQVAIATTGDSCRSFFSVDNTTNEADGIQALQSDGFQVGTQGSVNTSGTTYYWTAFGGDDVVTGSYTGNASDNRSITGVGFQPSFLWIKSSGNVSPAMRFSGQSGDNSFVVGWTNAQAANAIQAFEADGFQVGTSNLVNASATTYYYAAVKASSDAFVSSTFTGNATDNRSITGVGFTPDVVFIARSVAGRHGIMRSSANSGDDTTYISSQSVNFANGIQALNSDGFEVGTDSKVNTSAGVYLYVAARSTPAAASTFIPRIIMY